jgi:four helix bundle protein
MEIQKQPQNICERTFNFAIRIIKLCQVLEQKSGGVEKTLSKQLLRSGTSIGANVEEAQAGKNTAPFPRPRHSK